MVSYSDGEYELGGEPLRRQELLPRREIFQTVRPVVKELMRSIDRIALWSVIVAAFLVGACSSSTSVPTPTQTSAQTAAEVPTADEGPSPTPTATVGPEPSPTPRLEALFEYTRAVQLLDIQEYEDAIPAYGLVIRRLPDFALAYHGRGLAYYHLEQIGLAIEDFDKAIELDPEFADAYRNRGVVHLNEGDTEKAISDLEMALSLYHPVRDAASLLDVRLLLEDLR